MNNNDLKPVCVINNPESVVEVMIDTFTNEIVELKRLNNNRYKRYAYGVDDYLERNKHNDVVFKSVHAALN